MNLSMCRKHRHYNGIDLFKYIMSLAVITIHLRVLDNLDYPVAGEWFIRMAVPYFFMVSGFFLCWGMEREQGNLRYFLQHRSIRLFRLFFLWLLIYLPLSIRHYYHAGTGFSQSVSEYLSSVVIYGESVLAWPLWYIYSYAIFCLILSFMRRRISLNIFMVVCVMVYLIEFMENNMIIDFNSCSILNLSYILTHRTLGGGIYLFSGMLVYKLRNTGNAFLFAVSFIVISFILKLFTIPFWQVVGGTGFFLLALSLDFPDSKVWYKLRLQSMWIYYTHMYVLVLLMTGIPAVSAITGIDFAVCPIVVVALISGSLVGYILYRISQTRRLGMLNNLVK